MRAAALEEMEAIEWVVLGGAALTLSRSTLPKGSGAAVLALDCPMDDATNRPCVLTVGGVINCEIVDPAEIDVYLLERFEYSPIGGLWQIRAFPELQIDLRVTGIDVALTVPLQ